MYAELLKKMPDVVREYPIILALFLVAVLLAYMVHKVTA